MTHVSWLSSEEMSIDQMVLEFYQRRVDNYRLVSSVVEQRQVDAPTFYAFDAEI